MRRFLMKVGLGILALILIFLLGLLWHEINPCKDLPRIRQSPGGLTIDLPKKADDD